jgi:threonyl-tRNA synthetase
MLVIGEKEVAEEKVSVRRQGKGDEGIKSLEELIKNMQEEIKSKKAFTLAT